MYVCLLAIMNYEGFVHVKMKQNEINLNFEGENQNKNAVFTRYSALSPGMKKPSYKVFDTKYFNTFVYTQVPECKLLQGCCR